MTAALLTAGKELRGLLPAWAVAMAAVAGASALQAYTLEPVILFAYGIGSVALGSQLFGLEFGHRTLGLLLTQPMSRRVLFVVKSGVLALLMLAFVAFSAAMLSSVSRGRLEPAFNLQWTLVVAMAGFALAPCFTLLTRSGFAGLVFSVAVPGLIALVSELTAIWWYGNGAAAEIDAVRGTGLWRGMLIASAAAAAASWWLFMGIEDSDGRRRELQMPDWLSRSGSGEASVLSTRHPLLQLAIKELHLQQMAFVVAGLFCLAAVALLLSQDFRSDRGSWIIEAVVGLYFFAIALIVGSLASAEERQFGTLQCQMLLPVPARTQWSVKAGVALTLAMVLGIGLPGSLLWAAGLGDSWSRVALRVPFVLVLLTSVAIYVSSLSTSGVRAILAAMAAAFGGLMVVNWISSTIFWFLVEWDRGLAFWYFRRTNRHSEWSLMIEAAVVSALLLFLASRNHREIERSIRLSRQIAWIAGVILVVRISSFWL